MFALIGCDTSSNSSLFFSSEPEKIDTDPRKRPSDWRFDYWVGDVIEYADLDERNIYNKGEKSFSYLDSAYSTIIGTDGTFDFKKEKVSYRFTFRKEGLIVSSIDSTDPKNTIYKLSMFSGREEMKKTFEKMGFEYLDYSGFDPCYMKEHVEFRIYESHISVTQIFFD